MNLTRPIYYDPELSGFLLWCELDIDPTALNSQLCVDPVGTDRPSRFDKQIVPVCHAVDFAGGQRKAVATERGADREAGTYRSLGGRSRFQFDV